MNGKKFNELDLQEAEHIKRNHVCSKCWGALNTERVPGTEFYKVVCPKCGEDQGFVTKAYVERRRQENHFEAIEAKHNLGKILGIPEEPFDREEATKKMWPG